jgi:hypothetical protein
MIFFLSSRISSSAAERFEDMVAKRNKFVWVVGDGGG